MDANILILDQSPSHCAGGKCNSLRDVLQRSLAVRSIDVRHGTKWPAAIARIPDLVLLRFSPRQFSQELVASCKKTWRRAATLAVLCPESDRLPDLLPVLANVDDFLTCPFQNSELLVRAERLLQVKTTETTPINTAAPLEQSQLETMVGRSDVFLRALEKVTPLAHARAPVLISGETGTGKELFARALHYEGPRHGKPFITVNCGALPDQLFENELFGHTKGAFTDASSAEKGLIAEAEGGTLFLDEVDALSAPGQIKLLRFLQDGEYRAIGSSRCTIGDVRVIAATNADLLERVKAKVFREDLFYRLNALSLRLPALRERLDDILHLVVHFLKRFAFDNNQNVRQIAHPAVQKLMSHSWPGNVRELEGVIASALVFSASPMLEAGDIQLPIVDPPATSTRFLREIKSDAVNNVERAYLAQLLTEFQGNITRAAKAAGKERRSFQRLLRKHNLDRQLFRL